MKRFENWFVSTPADDHTTIKQKQNKKHNKTTKQNSAISHRKRFQEGNRTRVVAPRRIASHKVMLYDEQTVYQTEDGQFVIPARDDLFEDEASTQAEAPPVVAPATAEAANDESTNEEGGDEDDQPPTLVPEQLDPEEMAEREVFSRFYSKYFQLETRYIDGELIRVASPGGTRQYLRVTNRVGEDGKKFLLPHRQHTSCTAPRIRDEKCFR